MLMPKIVGVVAKARMEVVRRCIMDGGKDQIEGERVGATE